MAFRILVIEDRRRLASATRDMLDEVLAELDDQLVSWVEGWPSHKSITWDVHQLSHENLHRLTEANEAGRDVSTVIVDALSGNPPDAIILDLALTAQETESLELAGGTDSSGQSNPIVALRGTTGIALLRVLRKSYPVIVTTLASNPRVTQYCLANGAYAVVVKPFPTSSMTAIAQAEDSKDLAQWGERITGFDREISIAIADRASHQWIHVESYFHRLASEILKAVREVAIRRTTGHTPGHIPYWVATEYDLVLSDTAENTILLLLDVRGFSELVRRGTIVPRAVFEMMNIVWEVVLEVLKKYRAEVNNFIGDAALAFMGVYPLKRAEPPVLVSDAIDCAVEIVREFDMNGRIRERLLRIIKREYYTQFKREQHVFDEMVEHIKSENFGVRIVICPPDRDESVFGWVGTRDRWQHTILSRFMNALSRVESAASSWEREGLVSRRHGNAYLLLSCASDVPLGSEWKLVPIHEVIGEQGPIRDVPEDMQIFLINTSNSIS